MTAAGPRPAATPFDRGNTLLDEVPAQMTAIWTTLSGRRRLAVTIRTSSATVTALLTPADAGNWARLLQEAARTTNGTTLIRP